jgi:hypothetical protein
MPLGTVAEVLTHGGYLPQLAELDKKKRSVVTRRNGMAFSLVWCLFFLFIMTPMFGLMGIDELAGAAAIMGIFGGFIILVSSVLFIKKEPLALTGKHHIPPQQHDLRGQPGYSALPPQQANDYGVPRAGSWRDTNDLQPSVTESTTKLLEKDDRPR